MYQTQNIFGVTWSWKITHFTLDFSPKGQILCSVIVSEFHIRKKVPLPLQTKGGLFHRSYAKTLRKQHLIQWVSLAESSEETWRKFAKTCQKLSGENQLKCLILILFVLFVGSLWEEGRSCLFLPVLSFCWGENGCWWKEESPGRDWEEVVYSVLFSLERGNSSKTGDDPVKGELGGGGGQRKEN